ncbi:MAG: hypothetical protein Q8Q07_04640 [Dehalococcoidales bacterium]|nr:hypothetical protein [Dehalococcoidales bacterium]MDZ4230241.1 hypothetical protein [Dehalococcoidales bacterium]
MPAADILPQQEATAVSFQPPGQVNIIPRFESFIKPGLEQGLPSAGNVHGREVINIAGDLTQSQLRVITRHLPDAARVRRLRTAADRHHGRVSKGKGYLLQPVLSGQSVSIKQDYHIVVCRLYPGIGCPRGSAMSNPDNPHPGEGSSDLSSLIGASVVHHDYLNFTSPPEPGD